MMIQVDLSKPHAFDVETDGLWDTVTKAHCMVIKDINTGESWSYDPDHLEEGCKKLYEGSVIIAHNGVDFDIPVLFKLGLVKSPLPPCLDTLIMSRLLYPDRIGGHSLKAWGKRLGILKGDFAEDEDETVWEVFTPEMLEYCERDVEVLAALFNRLWRELNEED